MLNRRKLILGSAALVATTAADPVQAANTFDHDALPVTSVADRYVTFWDGEEAHQKFSQWEQVHRRGDSWVLLMLSDDGNESDYTLSLTEFRDNGKSSGVIPFDFRSRDEVSSFAHYLLRQIGEEV